MIQFDGTNFTQYVVQEQEAINSPNNIRALITDKKGNAQFSYAGNIAGHSVSLLFDQNKKKGIIIVADTDELLDQLGFQLLYKL